MKKIKIEEMAGSTGLMRKQAKTEPQPAF